MNEFGFYPDQTRAKWLDSRMRSELALSLKSINSQLGPQLSTSQANLLDNTLSPVLSILSSGKRVNPALFANYYQLVKAIENAEDNMFDILEQLTDSALTEDHLHFRELSAESLGSNEKVALYESCMDTDPDARFGFAPPPAYESEETKRSIQRAIQLMELTVPELAAEFEAIIIEVILAAAEKSKGKMRFDGASSYMLWGALMLSVDDQKSDIEMLETLAHEAGHSFLFGLTMKEPLVKNDPNTLYQSPLRRDARPMDGIYHATYVSARMHYAVRSALDSGVLDEETLLEGQQLLEASKLAFENGYGVVSTQGELSPSGRVIIDGAYQYMAQGATRH